MKEGKEEGMKDGCQGPGNDQYCWKMWAAGGTHAAKYDIGKLQKERFKIEGGNPPQSDQTGESFTLLL